MYSPNVHVHVCIHYYNIHVQYYMNQPYFRGGARVHAHTRKNTMFPDVAISELQAVPGPKLPG